jgi:hydrogenase expression/formation protein HypC
MCLAIPGKVLSRYEDIARVDFGEGTTRDVDVSLVDVKVGEYIIVHAGFAIEVVDEKEALETLRIWDELLSKG